MVWCQFSLTNVQYIWNINLSITKALNDWKKFLVQIPLPSKISSSLQWGLTPNSFLKELIFTRKASHIFWNFCEEYSIISQRLSSANLARKTFYLLSLFLHYIKVKQVFSVPPPPPQKKFMVHCMLSITFICCRWYYLP